MVDCWMSPNEAVWSCVVLTLHLQCCTWSDSPGRGLRLPLLLHCHSWATELTVESLQKQKGKMRVYKHPRKWQFGALKGSKWVCLGCLPWLLKNSLLPEFSLIAEIAWEAAIFVPSFSEPKRATRHFSTSCSWKSFLFSACMNQKGKKIMLKQKLCKGNYFLI